MKRLLVLVMICLLCLTGCSEEYSSESLPKSAEKSSEEYSIGDEINLADLLFSVYKVKGNELYLIAKNNVAVTAFSDSDRDMDYLHEYEGSLVEGYVNRFVDDLEDAGFVINSSGIIDKDDLFELGFKEDGLNGTKYRFEDAPDFIKNETHFWVDGYCKYDTYA